jgi:hypothetical protein
MEKFGLLKYEWQTNLGTYPETPILYTIARVNGSRHCFLTGYWSHLVHTILSHTLDICTVVLHLANREQQCMPWKSLKVLPANEPKTLDWGWQWFVMTLLENDAWVCADLHALRVCPLLLQLWHDVFKFAIDRSVVHSIAPVTNKRFLFSCLPWRSRPVMSSYHIYRIWFSSQFNCIIVNRQQKLTMQL